MRRISALAVLLAVGCAHAPPPIGTTAPAWRELVSRHFVLRTDATLDDARRALRDFETTWAIFERHVLPSETPPRGPVEVVLVGAHYFGNSARTDLPRAAALHRRACDLGHLEACNNLGECHETGSGVAKDIPRAIALYTRACDGGAAIGCISLASAHLVGLGVAKDDARVDECLKRVPPKERARLAAGVGRSCSSDPRGCTLADRLRALDR